jgi:hypothetical protein
VRQVKGRGDIDKVYFGVQLPRQNIALVFGTDVPFMPNDKRILGFPPAVDRFVD